MGPEIQTVCDRLLASAFNGVYQGVVVTALVAVILRALKRINAATRHAAWFCTLLLLVFLVVAHCFVASRPFAPQTTPAAEVAPSNQEMNSATLIAADDDYSSAEHDQSLCPNRDSLSLLPITLPTEAADPLDENPASLSEVQSEDKPDTSVIAVEQLAGPERKGGSFDTLIQRLANPIPLTLAIGSPVARISGVIALGLCMALVSLRILNLLLRLRQIRTLKRDSLPPNPATSELFQELVCQLGLRRKVELKTSPTAQSLLLGFFHPVILLPPEEQMERGQAEQILRHELAHVQRRDDWANLVQHFILAAFPFHPAVWWISQRLSLEREIACDDHVLQASAHPRVYALLLANLAARLQRCPPMLAPGASNNKTQLQKRIDMILNTHRNTSPRLAATPLTLITSAAAFFTLAVVCAAPRIVLAQNDPAPAAANAPAAAGAPVGAPAGDAPVGGAPALAIAAVNFEPDALEAGLPALPGTTPRPAAIAPGPKFKPGVPHAITPQPVAVPAPPTPALPGAPAALTTPPAAPEPFLASADAVSEPRPGRTPRPPRGRSDSSLEERLERLERMVESLVARQDENPFRLKSPRKEEPIDRKEIAKIEAFAKRQADIARKQMIEPKEFEKIKEHAKLEAAQAAEQAKRATVEAEKAARAVQKRQATREMKDGHRRELEALRRQLEMLEREKEKLDRQIERLEQNEDQLDEQPDEDQASGQANDPHAGAPEAGCGSIQATRQ